MKRSLLLLALASLAGTTGCGLAVTGSGRIAVVGPRIVWTGPPVLRLVVGVPEVRYSSRYNLLSYGGRYYWHTNNTWYYSSRWDGGFVACGKAHPVPRAFLRIPKTHVMHRRVVVKHPRYKVKVKTPPPGHLRPPRGRVKPPRGRVKPPSSGRTKDPSRGRGGKKTSPDSHATARPLEGARAGAPRPSAMSGPSLFTLQEQTE